MNGTPEQRRRCERSHTHSLERLDAQSLQRSIAIIAAIRLIGGHSTPKRRPKNSARWRVIETAAFGFTAFKPVFRVAVPRPVIYTSLAPDSRVPPPYFAWTGFNLRTGA